MAGIHAKMAVKGYDGWGTAFSTTGLVLVPLRTENLKRTKQLIEMPILRGRVGGTKNEFGSVVVGDSIDTFLDYNNSHELLYAAMGAYAAGPPKVYTFDDQLAQTLKIMVERTVSRLAIGSAKVVGFEISGGGVDEAVTMSLTLAAQDSENVVTVFPGLSFTDLNPLTLKQGRLFVGDLADELTDADLFSLASFTLKVERNFKTDILGTPESGHDDPELIYEPDINGFRAVSLRIALPKYTSDAFVDWKKNETDLQAVLRFDDGAEQVKFELPQLQIGEGFDPTTPGAEMRTQEGTLNAYTNDDNANSGDEGDMGTIADELRITVT